MAVGYTAPDLERVRMATQAPAPQEAKPIAYAHDAEYERASNLVKTGLAKLQSSRTTNEQRLGEDYTSQVGKAGKQNEANLNALQEKLANQGIRRSGINVAEQGRLGQNYQDVIAQLATGKQRGMEDIAAEYAAKQAEYQDQMSQAEIGRAERQTAREEARAAAEAQAKANKDMADQQRTWMAELSAKLTTLTQPQPQPTGQMQLPKTPPQQMVQQAIRQVPPPAAKTPQQQAQEAGIDPKFLQQLLAQRGFSPGPIDGIMGIKTQRALAHWKQSVGLPATADITPEIFSQLHSSGIGTQPTAQGSTGPTIGVATPGPARRAF